MQTTQLQLFQDRVYAIALAASISIWFFALRSPLWLDETHSYFVIKNGFSGIIPRMGWPIVPVYPYILWLWSKALGTSEVALRIPSLLAMLGAVYLLYLASRELFDREIAAIVAIVFCLHPIVIFASIDARPYAFAALAINASIWTLVRLRHNHSSLLAAWFGFAAACIGHFLFIFVVILPALAIGFIVAKYGDRKDFWRQAGVALAVFAVAFLPVVYVLQTMFRGRSTHVFEQAPKPMDLFWTASPQWLAPIFAITALLALAKGQLALRRPPGWGAVFCASLAIIPLFILYGVSVETSIHVFVARYRLVAIPGIALGWGLMVSRINSRTLRSLFCVALVASVAYSYFSSPLSRHHGYTWKYALEFAEKDASADHAPVLICSDFPESDSMSMPDGEAVKDSNLFAPLAYYQISVPVVGLPRALNGEARNIVSNFLRDPGHRRQRFLALAYFPSEKTIHFIEATAAPTHDYRKLGVFDGVEVVEFTPRPGY